MQTSKKKYGIEIPPIAGSIRGVREGGTTKSREKKHNGRRKREGGGTLTCNKPSKTFITFYRGELEGIF